MKTIPIFIGDLTVHFIVDDEDYPLLIQYNWSGFETEGRYYATTRYLSKPILMHRFILRLFDSTSNVVDHIDRNPLNNQKVNLRLISQSQNVLNSNRFDKIKGVHFDKTRNKWAASTRLNGVKINIGRFQTETEARIAFAQFKLENDPNWNPNTQSFS